MRKFIATALTILTSIAAISLSSTQAHAQDTVGVYLDNVPGVDSRSAPTSIATSGNKLFFLQLGVLYAYDKVARTTTQLIQSGAVFKDDAFGIVDGKLVFNAWLTTDPGQELYISDGTVAGTGLLKDILPGTAESQPGNFMKFGTKIAFTIRNPDSTMELWITDGTTAGTIKVRSFNYVYSPGSAVLNGRLYFSAADSGYNQSLWSTDGLNDTRQVSAVTPTGTSMAVLGSWLYFAGEIGGSGSELLRTNGTTTEVAADINTSAPGASSSPNYFAVLGSKIYFGADDGTHGFELMSYDGSAAALVKDQVTGANSSNPQELTAIAGKIYYSAVDSTGSRELYSTDGTTENTGLLAEIYPGVTVCNPLTDMMCMFNNAPTVNSSNPRQFTAFDSKIVFAATDGVVGGEIFAITPSAVTPSPTPTQTNTPALAPEYKGPVLNPIANRVIDSEQGGSLVITGTRLGSIGKIFVGDKILKTVTSSDTEIEVQVPPGAAGPADLEIEFASGKMLWANAFSYFDPMIKKAEAANRLPKAVTKVSKAKTIAKKVSKSAKSKPKSN